MRIRPDGECSSVVELRIVDPAVAGSIPVTHPNSFAGSQAPIRRSHFPFNVRPILTPNFGSWTVPPTLIWEELSKAYDYNSRTLWVINVGDLKPAEIGMDFSLQYAYDTSKYNHVTIQNYLSEFATRHFGQDQSREIATILSEFYELNFQRKPEHMGFNRSQDPRTNPVRTEFSAIHHGDEVNQRLTRFRVPSGASALRGRER